MPCSASCGGNSPGIRPSAAARHRRLVLPGACRRSARRGCGDQLSRRSPPGRRAAQSSGQRHASLFRRLTASRLAIAEERVTVEQGDTRFDLGASAAVASRSTSASGGAIVRTVDLVLAKGRRIASLMLEAAEADIAYESGHFLVSGTDRRISLLEVAARAAEMRRRGEIAEALDTKGCA